MVGTIDHLMGVASPVNSRFLIQSIRTLTSDLILDEIDQFDGEDIAATGRLVFQAGAAGRRVIIMSATLTADIAHSLHTSYSLVWSDFARSDGISKHVNLLCTGDASGSCFTNENGASLRDVVAQSHRVIIESLESCNPLRRGEILPACDAWEDLVTQVDVGCSRMHDAHAVEIEDFRVSVGMVRLTRISHTSAMAAQLASGSVRGRLRVILCLHSNFPLLHRSWIETRLKRALTRKGMDPEGGVRDLCKSEGLLARASAISANDIEIIVVTSPVIETGNDFDFDYAILDPISMRSIVQSAGRVSLPAG
jgi:CRISPR-associated endonuclease/helicase Cas3